MPINAIAPGNECRHASRSARLSTLTACGRTRCVADRTPRHPSPPTRSTSVRSSTRLGVSVGAAAGPLSPDAHSRRVSGGTQRRDTQDDPRFAAAVRNGFDDCHHPKLQAVLVLDE